MPIKIPNDLPAFEKLRNEGVRLIGEEDALQQDIRPMQVGLLNLMPEKPTTETQFARLLGATPLQVELTLLTTRHYRPNTVPLSHLQSFYRSWEQVADRRFDGLLITGAPVELLEFEEVKYWEELAQIFEWSRTHVHSTFNVCWGAQAALYHFHQVPKHTLPQKRFGVFRHEVIERRDAERSSLMRGFDDEFWVPVSRHTEVREEDLPTDGSIRVLARSSRAGLCLCEARHRHLFMFNHLEYDTFTLRPGVPPRPGTRAEHRDAAALLPGRRSVQAPGQPLAGLRPPAVRQLDQRDVPDHAVRAGADRPATAQAHAGLRVALAVPVAVGPLGPPSGRDIARAASFSSSTCR